MAKNEAAAAAAPGDAAATGKKKKLMFIIGGAVGVLVLGVVLGWLLLGGKHKEADEEAEEPALEPALYVSLGERFVAPLATAQGKPHYLQVSISAMTHDKAVVEELQFNAPLLRDRLNSVLSRQDFDRLRTEDGKVALRDEVLSTVQGIVNDEIASSAAKKKGDEEAGENEDEDKKPAKKKKDAKPAPEKKAPGVEQIFFTEFVLQ